MKLNSMASRHEFLKELSTSELDRMLQAELRKETIDDDLVRLVLSVLEDREQDYPVELNEEIVAAAVRFESSIDIQQSATAKTRWPMVLKVASVLLVVGLLLFVVPQAVNAESFAEMLARWTDSVFEFFSPSDPNDQPEYVFKTDHPGLQRIYDAVAEMGITDPVVPMWVPDGYVLQDMRILRQSVDTTILAGLTKENKYMFFNIIVHSEEMFYKHEKDAKNVTIIELNGVQHYVMSNFEEHIVAWVIDSVECSLITNCHEEELHSVLESIYTMEE